MTFEITEQPKRLYESRPFGSEMVLIADGSIPYHLSHAEFHDTPVPEAQAARREMLYDIQALLTNGATNEVTASLCRLTHRLSPGIYAREFFMPAGSVIVGQRHAREHMVFVLAGHSTVYTEYGAEEVHGPTTFISYAGVKRVLFNHTDAIWTTVHRTDATSIEEAEAELIINEQAEHEAALKRAAGKTWESVMAALDQPLLGVTK